jgi:hypothetical protein
MERFGLYGGAQFTQNMFYEQITRIPIIHPTAVRFKKEFIGTSGERERDEKKY